MIPKELEENIKKILKEKYFDKQVTSGNLLIKYDKLVSMICDIVKDYDEALTDHSKALDKKNEEIKELCVDVFDITSMVLEKTEEIARLNGIIDQERKMIENGE